MLDDLIPKVVSVQVLQEMLDSSFKQDSLLDVDKSDSLQDDSQLSQRYLIQVSLNVRKDRAQRDRENLSLGEDCFCGSWLGLFDAVLA